MGSAPCHVSKPFAVADKVNGTEESLHAFCPPRLLFLLEKSALEDPQALTSAGKHSCMSL